MNGQSKIERARAQAFSSAADVACNQFNSLHRTSAWYRVSSEFQQIWKNLKDISNDYHKVANELEAAELALAKQIKSRVCSICKQEYFGPWDKAKCDCGAIYSWDEGYMLNTKWAAREIRRLRKLLPLEGN